jgi:hypothetical protein
VFFIGRQDQVALKLYAALDRKSGQRHLKDLVAIDPTRAEMEFAVHWLLDRKTSPEFRAAIRRISEALGFAKLPALIAAENGATPKVKDSRDIPVAGSKPGKPKP